MSGSKILPNIRLNIAHTLGEGRSGLIKHYIREFLVDSPFNFI